MRHTGWGNAAQAGVMSLEPYTPNLGCGRAMIDARFLQVRPAAPRCAQHGSKTTRSGWRNMHALRFGTALVVLGSLGLFAQGRSLPPDRQSPVASNTARPQATKTQ